MTWNYRIILHDADNEEDAWYGLHEVFYDDKGEIETWTLEAISFVCGKYEGADGIIKSLAMALKDAKKRPVIITRDGEPEPLAVPLSGRAA